MNNCTISEMSQMCPVCQVKGEKSRLKKFHINFEEVMLLCERPECSYPLGSDKVHTSIAKPQREIKPKDTETALKKTKKFSSYLLGAHLKSNSVKCASPITPVGFQYEPLQSPKVKSEEVNVLSCLPSSAIPQVSAFPPFSLKPPCKDFGTPSKNFPLQPLKLGSVCVKSSSNSNCQPAEVLSGEQITSNGNDVKVKPIEDGATLTNETHVKKDVPNCSVKNNQENNLSVTDIKVTPALDTDIYSNGINHINNVSKSDKCSLKNNQENCSTPSEIKVSPISETVTSSNEINGKKDVPISDKVLLKNTSENCSTPRGSDKWFLQWENRDALCWLDVLLCYLVHNESIRKAVEIKTSCPNVTKKGFLVRTLLSAYEQALQLSKSILDEKTKGGVNLRDTKRTTNNHFTPELKENKHLVPDCDNKVCPQSIASVTEQTTTSTRKDGVSLKTGAGPSECCLSYAEPSIAELIAKNKDFTKARTLLNTLRELMWEELQPKLRCEKGRKDSPVFAIPLVLHSDPDISHLYQTTYKFETKCTKCGSCKVERYDQVLPSLPKVVPDFSMNNISHLRDCFTCQAPNQKRQLFLESLPHCVMIHFVEGITQSELSSLSFNSNGQVYEVRAVVQYKHNPSHFVLWIKHHTGPYWMECDDLKGPLCRYSGLCPNLPPSQIHIVFWEKTGGVGTPSDAQNTAKPGPLHHTSTGPTSHPMPSQKDSDAKEIRTLFKNKNSVVRKSYSILQQMKKTVSNNSKTQASNKTPTPRTDLKSTTSEKIPSKLNQTLHPTSATSIFKRPGQLPVKTCVSQAFEGYKSKKVQIPSQPPSNSASDTTKSNPFPIHNNLKPVLSSNMKRKNSDSSDKSRKQRKSQEREPIPENDSVVSVDSKINSATVTDCFTDEDLAELGFCTGATVHNDEACLMDSGFCTGATVHNDEACLMNSGFCTGATVPNEEACLMDSGFCTGATVPNDEACLMNFDDHTLQTECAPQKMANGEGEILQGLYAALDLDTCEIQSVTDNDIQLLDDLFI